VGIEEDLESVVAPACTASGVELFDLEWRPGVVKVTVDRSGGIDLDALAEASRAVSAALDAAGDLEPPGRYELEVTTPGVERRLRRPAHFAGALGERVAVRTVPGTAGDRRVEGALVSTEESGVLVSTPSGDRRLAFADIERAHTVYDWRAALAGPGGPGAAGRGQTTATTRERATTS